MLLAQILSAFCASLTLTYFMRTYALKRDLMDHPVERSSHTQSTPSGGGLAIVVSLIGALIISVNAGQLGLREAYAIALPSTAVAIIGFIDDHHPLSSRKRLFVHLIAGLSATLLLPRLPALQFGDLELTQAIVLLPTLTLALMWLTNLYNFMDGLDGIASIEGISVLLAAAAILHFHGNTNWPGLFVVSAAALAGFFLWNAPPAKIFMGDVGSGFLGIFIGIAALATAASTQLNLWSWSILLAVFVADTTWTLVTRIATRQNWTDAHCSHAYQKISRRVNSHLVVTLGVLVINVIWLAPLALMASLQPENGWAIALVAYAPLILVCRWQRGGKM